MVPLTIVIKDEPFSILLQQENLTSGRLLKPSRIRLDKIFNAEKDLISMKIGIVNDKIFQKIKQEITEMF